MVNDITLVIETCYLFVYWVVSATLQQDDNVIDVDRLVFGLMVNIDYTHAEISYVSTYYMLL